MMYKTNTSRQFALLAFILLLPISFAWAESTAYVSDELTVPMRSGDTTGHRIVKFLTSGTRLTVVDKNDDGSYTQVTTEDGKEGWVKTEHLMNNRSAREQLPALSKKVGELREDVKKLQKEKNELQQHIKKIEDENEKLASRIQELREVAAEPAAIADKNRRLTEQLEKVDAINEALRTDNERMKNMDLKLWFMIGGGVALVSLFLGLIIPSFNWGRKKSSWGGGF